MVEVEVEKDRWASPPCPGAGTNVHRGGHFPQGQARARARRDGQAGTGVARRPRGCIQCSACSAWKAAQNCDGDPSASRLSATVTMRLPWRPPQSLYLPACLPACLALSHSQNMPCRVTTLQGQQWKQQKPIPAHPVGTGCPAGPSACPQQSSQQTSAQRHAVGIQLYAVYCTLHAVCCMHPPGTGCPAGSSACP